MFDVLIVGGGVSGVSCALVLGSAKQKPFAFNKEIGIVMHQRASALQDAVFYNAYGIKPGTLGSELLNTSAEDLENLYPHVTQIHDEKVLQVVDFENYFQVKTTENIYETKKLVMAIGSGSPWFIEGLEQFVVPHQKALPSKNRIQLKNNDHLVKPNLFVTGTLAGCPSQLTIAAGSGAAVATDILTEWNEGIPTQVHDSIRNK
jgi:thioredoxin reductase